MNYILRKNTYRLFYNSSVRRTEAVDPVQALFLKYVREYYKKLKETNGVLFDVSPELEKDRNEKQKTLAMHYFGDMDPKLFEKFPELKYEEVHFEAIAISVDPYMRAIAHFAEPGITMFGEVVSKVVESCHPDYKVGDLVVGYFGWQTHYVGIPEEVDSPFGGKRKPYVLPDLHGLPPSLALGMLGMPGNSAYFGFTELCEPKPGKTLVISGAAGAVGSHVGQIGKILGCKVIGFAGSDDKVAYLQKELKFDFAFNYKKVNITEALKTAAPEGVDYYFDNVGGKMSSEILGSMNEFGRAALCGAVAIYNQNPSEPPLAPAVQLTLILKQIRMEGFLVFRWLDRWFEGINKNLEWIRQGKLIYKEHATKGFEKTAQAFIGMMKGDNTGKAVVLV